MDIGLTVRLDAPFAAVVERTRAALQEQGFGVLTEIDVRATLREKLGEQQAGQLLLQHAPYLTIETLQTASTAWATNIDCREAHQMPDLAVALYRDTAHLGAGQAAAFVTFLGQVQAVAKPGDSYYRYPALEAALRAGNHLQ